MNESIAERLTTARQRLAHARNALRRAEDAHSYRKATTEVRFISNLESIKDLGSNETDRKRNLELAISENVGYLEAHETMRRAQAELELAQCDLDCLLDQRRFLETEIKERFLLVLENANNDMISGYAESAVMGADA